MSSSWQIKPIPSNALRFFSLCPIPLNAYQWERERKKNTKYLCTCLKEIYRQHKSNANVTEITLNDFQLNLISSANSRVHGKKFIYASYLCNNCGRMAFPFPTQDRCQKSNIIRRDVCMLLLQCHRLLFSTMVKRPRTKWKTLCKEKYAGNPWTSTLYEVTTAMWTQI